MSTCPACGAESPAGQKFCGECGTPLAAVCGACGGANPPGQRFCGECGAALAAASRPAPAPAVSATERRLVSVLFADLVGFTTLSEARDAEEVRELLSRYFDACRRLIELYGGTVEKFIGDAVMAVWGTPTATEDDAERAVRAALDLVAAVPALGDELGPVELRARAGVVTGEAAVALGAAGEGMVAGDVVNTASRIQAVADPGTVLVGEATRRASERAVAYEDAGVHLLKGKEEPVALWRALRVVSGVGGQLRSEGLEPPFVGRESELRRVKELFHACAAEGRAQLVSVTGIAGIGKSRLAWEFYKYFDGIVDPVLWHRGRCLAYGEGVAYSALAEMVRLRCRIGEEERGEAAAAKLAAALAEYVLDEEERRFVEPRLARLLGLGAGDDVDRQSLFAGWRLFLERLAEAHPVLLVFEDVQWADASLLDFVEYLLEWSRGHRIFVVTLARPDLLERRPTWGAGQRAFTSLHLEPLPEEAMRELLAGLVPGLPEEPAARILGRAEGVPLYAVETVRMLLARGLLVQDGSAYALAGDLDALEVPETLHALIASRLDGLVPGERRLLQDAAVLGESFTRAALAALADAPEQELEPLLAGLVRKEVLTLQADPRSPEHGQYRFLQDLVRRVAYETLSKRERRARHLAAAEQLGAALEEEGAEVVAAHLLAAYRELPDGDDGALRARAGEALVRAGDRAASVGAAAEARRYFEQAAELSEDAAVRAELIFRAGRLAITAGARGPARELLERARQAFEQLGDASAEARVAVRLADVDHLDGNSDGAVTRLESALAALEAGGSREDVARVCAQLARMLLLAGREFDRALPLLERALELAEALELYDLLADALTTKALLLHRSARPIEALVLQEGAVALAVERNLHSVALRGYNNLGVYLAGLERWEEAAGACDRALELARRVGDAPLEANFLAAGVVGFQVGGWNEQLARLAEADLAAGGTTAYGHSLSAVAILCERGSLDEARELLALGERIFGRGGAQGAAIRILAEARVRRAEGRPREALDTALRAIEAAAEVSRTWIVAKQAEQEAVEAALAAGERELARELLGRIGERLAAERTAFLRAQHARLSARVDADEDAAARRREAERLFREAGAPFHLAVTLLERAEAGEGDVEALLAEARELFASLGARPWLGRLEALEARAQPAAAVTRS